MISKKISVLALLLFVSTVASWAQYQSRIKGRVLDPSGNPVDKAEVTLVSQRTSSIRYESKTDKEGRFVQVGLMPGYYMLSVKKTGFAPGSKEIKVGIAGEESVEIALKTVEAEAEKTYSAADKSFLKGNKLYAEQKYAEAVAAYEGAVGLDPGSWAYRLNLGLSLKKAGQLEAALPRFQRAVELKPDYAEAYYQMGTILVGQNKVAEACASLEKFLALAPGHEKAGIAKQLLEFLKKK